MPVDIQQKNIAEKFASYPLEIQPKLLRLRALIFQVAEQDAAIGKLEETLKWGQLSYLTSQTKAGTTLRIDHYHDDELVIYVHCQTHLIEDFRALYGDIFKYQQTRALIFTLNEPATLVPLQRCIHAVLTYHQKI